MLMCCCGEPVSWSSNIGLLFGLQQNQNYETNMLTLVFTFSVEYF